MSAVLGWDIGGANLKVARIEGDPPRVSRVLEEAFALWRAPEKLAARLGQLGQELGPTAEMAVTTTAELADCFATKAEGVRFVLDALASAFPASKLHVYGVDGRFHSRDEAAAHPRRIAAANWRATATLAAASAPDAILVDVGSTTSDLISIVAGRVAARGLSDTARLASGELIFTGALRTPVCAVTRSLPYRGRRCRLAAEWFAIAADAHLWLGSIRESDYTCETPDGRGRSRNESGARLARMIAADRDALTEADITAIAEAVASAQVRAIASGLRQVLKRLGERAPRLALLAGAGAFLGREAAASVGLESRALELDPAAARAAPAAAVGLLLAGHKSLK